MIDGNREVFQKDTSFIKILILALSSSGIHHYESILLIS